jgi:hypothetical protein
VKTRCKGEKKPSIGIDNSVDIDFKFRGDSGVQVTTVCIQGDTRLDFLSVNNFKT